MNNKPTKLEDTYFRNKVFSGNFTENDLRAMITNYTKEGNTTRIGIIEEYQQSKGMTVALKKVMEKNNQDFEEYVAKKFLQIKESAKERKLEFNLKLIDVRNLLRTKTCFYTGMTFVNNDVDDRRLTFDRKDPTKGYIKGNVVACTFFVNQFKNDFIEKSSSWMKDNPEMLVKVANRIRDVYPIKEVKPVKKVNKA